MTDNNPYRAGSQTAPLDSGIRRNDGKVFTTDLLNTNTIETNQRHAGLDPASSPGSGRIAGLRRTNEKRQDRLNILLNMTIDWIFQRPSGAGSKRYDNPGSHHPVLFAIDNPHLFSHTE